MKRGLSKNLLRMKFMQRTAMEAEKQQSLADRVITSEEWRYEPALLSGLPHPPPLRRVVSRPDHLPVCAGGPLGPVLPLQPAAWGRVSFGGFNPAVEKLMAECGRGDGGPGAGVSVELEAEAGATVSAERLQMQRRQRQQQQAGQKKSRGAGGCLATSVARKFDTKRARKRRLEAEEEAGPAAEAEAAESPPEEGEVDDEEDEEVGAVQKRRRLPPGKREKRKLRKQQQQQQQQQGLEVAGDPGQEEPLQLQQAKKMKKKNKRKLGQSVLPHPSTLLAGRKRKAQPDEDA